jgi:hypothetical protein
MPGIPEFVTPFEPTLRPSGSVIAQVLDQRCQRIAEPK